VIAPVVLSGPMLSQPTLGQVMALVIACYVLLMIWMTA
jgi:hypothetical protein